MQQIAISGVGGQGILFITKLLAETAVELGHAVLISETHGMAQRGGNVISHLKVGERQKANAIPETGAQPSTVEPYRGAAACRSAAADPRLRSPLIRPGCADILLALHPDGLASHGFYLKPGGRLFCSQAQPADASSLDAVGIATELGAPVCANLVLLGFAVGSGALFCRPHQVEEVLRRAGGKRREINLEAFRAGVERAGAAA
jgi:indolepyruvate ferredoxin oxidoreductase, beta subunit